MLLILVVSTRLEQLRTTVQKRDGTSNVSQQVYAFQTYFDSATLALQQTDHLQSVALVGQNTGGQVAVASPPTKKPVAFKQGSKGISSDPFVLVKPVDYQYISQEFSSSHPGLDLVAPFGSPITAAASGCVVSTSGGFNGGYGNLTIEDIGDGYTLRYAHQERFADGIQAGSCVTAGQLIGYVGLTGHTTGPHLHFELRRNGIAVRPNLY